MSMKSLIAAMPWRRRASICWRSAASRASERCTINRTSGSVTLLSRSVSYWLNSEWTSASASARSTKPLRLVSRLWNSDRARFLRSSRVGPLGTSAEKGGSATLTYSSIVSLPSLLTSSSSNDFMRYFRNSARVTSPFLPMSISTNHGGSGTGGGGWAEPRRGTKGAAKKARAKKGFLRGEAPFGGVGPAAAPPAVPAPRGRRGGPASTAYSCWLNLPSLFLSSLSASRSCMSMKSLIAAMPWRRRASICWRSAASRASERCTINRTSGSVTLLSRSVSYWLNSEWTSASASARSTKPSRLVSRFWNSDRARFLRSSSVGPLGTSAEKGGSATLTNSSSESLPSLLTSTSSNDFMRYFRNSARVTSPFLSVSISTNHCGNGTGGGVPAACGAGDGPGAGGVAVACGFGIRGGLGGLGRCARRGGPAPPPPGRPPFG